MCNAASEYFTEAITASDVVWSYSGVRPLYDDGAKSATAATRDYVLKVESRNGEVPLLNVFGGKITTYRRLAEAAIEKLSDHFPDMSEPWTAGAPLPGGDFPVDGFDRLVADLKDKFPFLNDRWAKRLVRAYGTDAAIMLDKASDKADLGQVFGADLTEREVDWLIENEWARSGEDVVWRRSKLGLRMTTEEVAVLDQWMKNKLAV